MPNRYIAVERSSATGLTWYRMLAFMLTKESVEPAHACVKTSMESMSIVLARLRSGQLCGSIGSSPPSSSTMVFPSSVFLSFELSFGFSLHACRPGWESLNVSSDCCELRKGFIRVLLLPCCGRFENRSCHSRSTSLPIFLYCTIDHIRRLGHNTQKTKAGGSVTSLARMNKHIRAGTRRMMRAARFLDVT